MKLKLSGEQIGLACGESACGLWVLWDCQYALLSQVE